MTGPIIPADQWPEWADRHCWDKNGDGWFYGMGTPSALKWWPELRRSNIPMPAGHDWRVPVMRQQAPAIDLEQFRPYVEEARDNWSAYRDTMQKAGRVTTLVKQKISEIERLLALIDMQATKGDSTSVALPDGWRVTPHSSPWRDGDRWEVTGPNGGGG